MAMDIIAVLVDLEIPETDVMGYSMGGQLAIRLMHDAPGRVRRAILGGIGENYFRFSQEMVEAIAKGLLAKDPSKIADPVAREFRTFCERAGDDLAAMAACIRRPRRIFSPEDLHNLAQKVLVVCGEQDDIATSPQILTRAFSDASTLLVPKRNHHSTVGDRTYKDAAVTFLAK
jgi:pimeloyl-ACP methyl ester carboxylesterase